MDYFSVYDLKDTVIPMNRYLGANVGKWKFSDGSNCWWMNGRDYTANLINLSKKPMEQKVKLFVCVKRAKRPMLMSYRPEIDVNNTPIYWFSKRQNTVETSTFGDKLLAARIDIEKVKALHIKLRWIGIPIDGPTYMF